MKEKFCSDFYRCPKCGFLKISSKNDDFEACPNCLRDLYKVSKEDIILNPVLFKIYLLQSRDELDFSRGELFRMLKVTNFFEVKGIN